MSDPRPIGVFDSGVGGLTVLRALMDRLPAERYVYLGDTARVPYGTKDEKTVVHFAREAAQELLSRDVKRIVVACNTASAVALDTLRDHCPVPVEGVIDPGVEAALSVTQGRVGVIGTLATVGSGKYEAGLKARRADLDVVSQACPLFVPLAEEGLVEGPIPAGIAEHYLVGLRDHGVDTLILGCTHYPILKPVLATVMGPDVELVDSALVLADAVAADLDRTGDAAPDDVAADLQLLVTDVPQRFGELSRRFLAREVPPVEVVDLEAHSVEVENP